MSRMSIGSDRAETTRPMNTGKTWHPRLEMRWRAVPRTTTEGPTLEQLWQCDQTGQLWWRRVPTVVAWESDEP